jgi:hypothetical protein
VKVFVGDHSLDTLKVLVGGGVGAGQHIFGVEDVKTLVLHRPHVEVVNRHDHVDIEIIL